MVDRGDGDRDHLTLQLRQARIAQHQVVVHIGEGTQFLLIEGVGEQHVGHEAELLPAFVEIGFRRIAELRLDKVERGYFAGHMVSPPGRWRRVEFFNASSNLCRQTALIWLP
jgi:hypothetical protein